MSNFLIWLCSYKGIPETGYVVKIRGEFDSQFCWLEDWASGESLRLLLFVVEGTKGSGMWRDHTVREKARWGRMSGSF